MDIPAHPSWSMLVISLPGRSATPRMRVWRALKGLGAVVLRDGVYLLPYSESASRSLREQAEIDLQNISGVNLDEEASNMLRYQQAYLAASKVIGVADGLFQNLLQIVGR